MPTKKQAVDKILTLTLTLTFGAMVTLINAQNQVEMVWLAPFESYDDVSFGFNASSSVAALALGLDTVYKEQYLPGYTINVTVIDTKCNSKYGLGSLVDFLSDHHLDVVLGPPCPSVVDMIGQLLSYRNVPLINWVSTGQAIDQQKLELTTYIRVMAHISSLSEILMSFFVFAGWRRFILISGNDAEYRGASETLMEQFGLYEYDDFIIAHHYENEDLNITDTRIDEIFRTVVHEGRVIILLVPRDELRKYMVRAYHLGMTRGDYQFLFIETELLDQAGMRMLNSDRMWRRGDEDDDAARQAYESVLYFLLTHSIVPLEQWQDEATASYQKYFANRPDIPAPTELDELSGYLHDAVVTYARLKNKTLEDHIPGSGSDLYNYTINEYFKGKSGDVAFTINAERTPNFFVYDLNKNSVMHEVAVYQVWIENNKLNYNWSFTSIYWADGSNSDDYLPLDSPACGFFNELCPDPSSEEDSVVLPVAISVSVGMLVILLALYMVYKWWREESDLKNMGWKILPSQFSYNNSNKGQSSMISSKCAQSTGSSTSTISNHGSISNVGKMSISRGQIFTTVAFYKSEMVAVKKSKRNKITIDRPFLLRMKHLREMKHANLASFLGVSPVQDKVCSVWEYCCKGSVQDVIENDDIRLDTMFKLSLAVDICQGLEYIQKSPVKFHGNLRSSNCVIDSRWVCKLTDFGLERLRTPTELSEEMMGAHAFYARLFWTAPEVLRKVLKKEKSTGSQKADVYALGMIFKELLCRNEPYCVESDLSPKDIILKVANPPVSGPIFRPTITDTDLDSEYRRTNIEYLIQRCWAEEEDDRPVLKRISRTLTKINPYKKASVVDNMISMMEKYTNNLEDIVAERTAQLEEEKRKTDALLFRMLPRKVAEDLKVGRSIQAEAFESVTIYFSDIVQFTILASESTPLEIVALLNSLYTLFDDIISHFDVYKVETIGDAYMLVSGLPEKNGPLHVKEVAGVALDILRSVLSFQIPHKTDRQLQIRIGLHTGPVVAGVVGLTMPRYCLFGDTVNTASRMESNGKPLQIHLSGSTKTALDEFPDFIVEPRGEIPIKGKGMMETFWLLGKQDVSVDPDTGHGVPLHQAEADDTESPPGDQPAEKSEPESSNGLQVADKTNGKLSVADSGICMDVCQHDDTNSRSCGTCCLEICVCSHSSQVPIQRAQLSVIPGQVDNTDVAEVSKASPVKISAKTSVRNKSRRVGVVSAYRLQSDKMTAPAADVTDINVHTDIAMNNSVTNDDIEYVPEDNQAKSEHSDVSEKPDIFINDTNVDGTSVVSACDRRQEKRNKVRRQKISWPYGPQGIPDVSVSSESDDSDDDVTRANVPQKKISTATKHIQTYAVLKSPVRVSATDYMSVSNDWFKLQN